MGLALGLSLGYTLFIQLLVWRHPLEEGPVLLLTMGVRTVFFLGLDALYRLLVRRWQLRVDAHHIPFPRYIAALLLFMTTSLAYAFLLYGLYRSWQQQDWRASLQFDHQQRIMYFLEIVLSGIYFLVRCFFDALDQLLRASLAVERYQREKTQAHLDTLKSQISPHFLFNSLNALSSLIHTDEEKAVRFVDELAIIFRYVLNNKDKELVPLRAEIDFLNAYLYLLKIRFRDNLQVQMRIPAQYLTASIPPLTLQLLIENAIKHNIVSKDEPLLVEVDARNGYLTVRNNLQLREKSQSTTGVGLKNIRQRYDYLTDQPVNILQTQSEFVAHVPLLFTQEEVTHD